MATKTITGEVYLGYCTQKGLKGFHQPSRFSWATTIPKDDEDSSCDQLFCGKLSLFVVKYNIIRQRTQYKIYTLFC